MTIGFSGDFGKKVNDFSLMTNLSKIKRGYLKNNFVIEELELLASRKAMDGTEKIFALKDNNKIKAVFISKEKQRAICVSTQVECPLKCFFVTVEKSLLKEICIFMKFAIKF